MLPINTLLLKHQRFCIITLTLIYAPVFMIFHECMAHQMRRCKVASQSNGMFHVIFVARSISEQLQLPLFFPDCAKFKTISTECNGIIYESEMDLKDWSISLPCYVLLERKGLFFQTNWIQPCRAGLINVRG